MRGWKVGADGYILVDPPLGSLEDLKIGAQIIMRAEKAGTAYGFICTFKGALKKTNVWLFDFQKEDMTEVALRTGERFTCLVPARMHDKKRRTESVMGRGMINSMSLSGMSIVSRELIHVNKEDFVDVVFNLPHTGEEMRILVQILRIERKKKVYEYGGPFIGLEEEKKSKIEDYFEFCKEWSQ